MSGDTGNDPRVEAACVAYVMAGGFENGSNRLGVEGEAMRAALAAADAVMASLLRRAPVQGGDDGQRRPHGSVTWAEHVEAWTEYHRHHRAQDAETIARRAGFGYREMTVLLGHEPKTWTPGGIAYNPPPEIDQRPEGRQ